MWIGGALAMTLLMVATSPVESHEMYMRSLVLKLIDDWLIIPGAMGILLTAIVYGTSTGWGFFKHKWITAKWILTIFMIASGTFLMGPEVNSNVYPVQDIANYTLENSTFFDNVSQSLFWGSIQLSLLVFTIIISVLKPWKSKAK